MIRNRPHLVIDARPRGPRGLLAGESILGRPVLEHLLELAGSFSETPIAVHARFDEHERLRQIVGESGRVLMMTGPPPEDAAILRSDRLYDRARLRRAIARGKDPETAVIWRLDRPQGLDGAEDELIRRRTYQPIGRYWALGPARWIAERLAPTRIRPNAVTIASAALVLGASALVASGGPAWASRWLASIWLAVGLVLDTTDGHLARLQGTTSEFGRWLDANLDELGDMALHASIAWAAFARDANPAWLVVGMVYGMGKYLYLVGSSTGAALDGPSAPAGSPVHPETPSRLRSLALLAGHADLRWHLWIVLAAVGALDWGLVAYALYFPIRAVAGAMRKAARHA
jgi:phosphatidylglycerophosphate synthase